jgi:hypothetical protein
VNPRLVVARDSEKDIKIRGLFIYLDGEEVANLSYRDIFETEVSPGAHRLKATNTLFTQESEFEVTAGDVVRFQVSNRMTGILAALFGWSGIAPYKVTLERI